MTQRLTRSVKRTADAAAYLLRRWPAGRIRLSLGQIELCREGATPPVQGKISSD